MKTKRQLIASLGEMERSYIETALWSSNDESEPNGGEPLDANYSLEDLSNKALAQVIADCENFRNYCHQTGDIFNQALQTKSLSSIGHDFWLTRNGHGAGFWDGDYPEPLGDQLTEAAKTFGSCDAMVWKGKVYLS